MARFAELEKSPEYLHTYRITPLSLWNAAAAGMTAVEMLEALERYSKYDVPANVRTEIADQVSRYGRIRLTRRDGDLALESLDAALLAEIVRHKSVAPLVRSQPDAHTLLADPSDRGRLKQALVGVGYPAQDEAGYTDGRSLPIQLRNPAKSGEAFALRHYQQGAVQVFHAGGAASGGSGVIVLPCGAGKTLVGMGAVAGPQTPTLVLTPSTGAAPQLIHQRLDKTHPTQGPVG